MTGEKFNLENDELILRINSPQSSVEGPYRVVYKDLNSRWVIVALDWNGNPCLGMRWFWGKIGQPVSRNFPTWFIIPTELRIAVLNGLALEDNFRRHIESFLFEEISGEQLKNLKQ